MKIPLVSGSFYREAETQAALATFVATATRFSMGVECEQFERAFAAFQERKHAVFVSNGSMANLVLLQALLNSGRLKQGDRIGFSALTWATNVMPIIQLGMIPVPIDCTLDTLNISAETLAPHLEEIQGLFLTNVLGFCSGDLDHMTQECERRGIVLFEDNCESLGSRYRGTLLGNIGLASTFSFFIGHHLSTIEGGMICTDDDALHEMLVMVRAHGWDRNLAPVRQEALRVQHGISPFFAHFAFYELAYNARPTEINGFLGNTQIGYLPEIIAKREKNFRAFHSALMSSLDWYHPLDVSTMDVVSNFSMPVICKTSARYDACIDAFKCAGVEIRPVIAGDITKHPFYKKYVGTGHCATAATIHTHGFYFPNNADLSEDDVTFLCTLLTNNHAT